jgi:hypothetical protein
MHARQKVCETMTFTLDSFPLLLLLLLLAVV